MADADSAEGDGVLAGEVSVSPPLLLLHPANSVKVSNAANKIDFFMVLMAPLNSPIVYYILPMFPTVFDNLLKAEIQ